MKKVKGGADSIRKVTQAHSTHAKPEKTNGDDKSTETESKDNSETQVDALNQTIDSLKQLRTQTRASEQAYCPVYKQPTDKAML